MDERNGFKGGDADLKVVIWATGIEDSRAVIQTSWGPERLKVEGGGLRVGMLVCLCGGG